jgi:hypothetical protein
MRRPQGIWRNDPTNCHGPDEANRVTSVRCDDDWKPSDTQITVTSIELITEGEAAA